MNVEPIVTRLNRAVIHVHFDGVKSNFEQWVLLTSDIHYDSLHCDRKLFKQFLELALERQAKICIFGDLFDAMQGREDKRRKLDDLRPEYKTDAYWNKIMDDVSLALTPYAKNILLIAPGNHESAVLSKSNLNLLSPVIAKLNESGGNVFHGTYGGYIRFQFTAHKTVKQAIILKYHHGAGGGGEVTRGTIQTNRQAVYLPDADVVVNGHTHDGWVVPIARERLRQNGDVATDIMYFVRTPTFKNAHGDGGDGWDVETWKPPKPLGAVWLRFVFHSKQSKVTMEFTPMVF